MNIIQKFKEFFTPSKVKELEEKVLQLEQKLPVLQKGTDLVEEIEKNKVEKIISTADKKWPDAQPVIEFRIEYYLQHSSRIAAINYIREKMAQHQRNEVHLPRSYLIDLERRLQELEKNEN